MATGAETVQQGPSPPKRRRRAAGSGPRGSYASRVCLRCRSKKHKCVLAAAAVELPNSLDPIAKELRCSRCSENDADCVLWEDEARLAAKRKRGTSEQRQDSEPRTGASGSSSAHVSRDSSTTTDLRSGLGSLAAAAAQQLASSQNASSSNVAGPSYMHSNGTSPVQALTAAPVSHLSSVPHYPPAPALPPSQTSHGTVWAPQTSSVAAAAPEAPTPMTATQQLLIDNLSVSKTSPAVRRKAFSAATMYGLRPVELLSQFLVRTAGWCSNADRSAQVELATSPVVLVGEELSSMLEPWVQAHYLWHPDLPSLSELRAEHVASPSTASAFLLAVLYHITLPHLNPQPLDAGLLSVHIATCLRREAVAVLMGVPASSYAIQGLMLLHEHDPAALLPPLPAGEQRGSEGIVGYGLLSTALSIAKAIQLDQAPAELKRLFSSLSSGGSTPDQATRAAVASATNRAALWHGLQRWRVTLAIEELDIRMPDDLREAEEDTLQVDVDEYISAEPNEAHQLRRAGRIMLHVRLAKLREIVLTTDQYAFAESMAEAQDHEGRVEVVMRVMKHSLEQIDAEMAQAKRLLTPLLAVSPGVGVLMQAVKLDLHASHTYLFFYSWSFVLFGVKAKVWLPLTTGTKDFLDRSTVHPSVAEFAVKQIEVRSAQVESLLLAMTDVACAGASSPSCAFDTTRAAVAAMPMLPLAALTVYLAKGELDQKATMMAHFHTLRKDTGRHVTLLRFAARCLREMDPAVRRGELDTETGIRCGNVRLTAASLVSSMAETMAEWKALIDGHAVPASNAIDASSNNASSSASTPSAPGLSIQQFVAANPYLSAAGPQASSSMGAAPTQGFETSLDSMLGNPTDWNDLVTDWILMDAGPSEGQDAFDWASIFGFPAAPAPSSGFQ